METPWFENPELIDEVTKVVRDADVAYQVSGGGSRHWLRDQFLPKLDAAGFKIVKKET